MPDTDHDETGETGENGQTEVRWHLEPYDPDVDDAPEGDEEDCVGDGDVLEGDDGAP
jgi:hypothetical protein